MLVLLAHCGSSKNKKEMKDTPTLGLEYFQHVLLSLWLAAPHDPEGISPEVRTDLLKQACCQVISQTCAAELQQASGLDFRAYLNGSYRAVGRLMEEATSLCEQGGPSHRVTCQRVMASLETIGRYMENGHGQLLGPELPLLPCLVPEAMECLAGEFQKVRHLIPGTPAGILLTQRLERFTSGQEAVTLTRGSMDYFQQLVRRISDWDWQSQDGPFCPVQRFLVYINFNSKELMDLLVRGITENCKDSYASLERAEMLRKLRANFNQLHRKPGIILNPGYISLDTFLNGWFDLEIELQSGDSHGRDPNRPEHRHRAIGREEKALTLNASADQLAILLRLLDEERVVNARSLSQVFQCIVPHLSTIYRKDLSPSSVRVKSYHPEEGDKMRVIQILQGMVSRVKEY